MITDHSINNRYAKGIVQSAVSRLGRNLSSGSFGIFHYRFHSIRYGGRSIRDPIKCGGEEKKMEANKKILP